MATSALLLLAVFALAVEGNPKPFPAMFKDFREGKHGKAKTASSNYGYEESELQGKAPSLLCRSCGHAVNQRYYIGRLLVLCVAARRQNSTVGFS
jgi:hypothetical protein